MRISVKVKPGAKKDKVERVSDKELSVRLKAPPKEGKANKALIDVLSEYFSIPKSRITIARGESGRNKIIDIL